MMRRHPLLDITNGALDGFPVEPTFPAIRPGIVDRANDHHALDITRARNLLDWEPKRSLRETLPKMIDALKANPLGWYEENELNPPRSLRQDAGQRTEGTPDEH